MKIYWIEAQAPRRVLALVKHLGIAAECIEVDLMAGGLQTEAYARLNPNRKAPTLVDGDVVLWESSAIMAYLCIKAGSDMWPAHAPAEVICHNDFAPYNLAFRDGLPVGAIDFEAASPGPRAWDLAYLAYRLVPLAHPSNPDLPPQPDPEARLARLCAAYGDIDPAAVLALVPPRLDALAAGAPPAHAALYRADAAYLRSG